MDWRSSAASVRALTPRSANDVNGGSSAPLLLLSFLRRASGHRSMTGEGGPKHDGPDTPGTHASLPYPGLRQTPEGVIAGSSERWTSVRSIQRSNLKAAERMV